MRLKIALRTIMLALAVVATVLVVRSTSHKPEDGSCKESMDEDCCQQKKEARGKMIWENLPNQFFSSL